jgi:nucleoid-associated protein YgaU
MLCAGLVAGRWSLSTAAPTVSKTSDAGISPATHSTVAVYQDSLLALRQQLAANKELHTNATPGSGFMYVVRRGDTLRGIAWRLYGRVELAEQLGQLNQIADPRRLPIGKRLRLLSI